MTTVAAENLHPQRIQRLSRTLAQACLVLIVALPLAVIGYWLVADTAHLTASAQLPVRAPQAPLQDWQRGAGALITLVPLTLLLIGLAQARQCFRRFAAGEVFSTNTVRCLQRFAGWVMASVAASMVAGSIISVLLTLNNPPGMRQLVISVGTDQIFTLFFAGMVWLMAAVIGQGQTLAEENATFV
jgi:hypothetical protein